MGKHGWLTSFVKLFPFNILWFPKCVKYPNEKVEKIKKYKKGILIEGVED